MPRRPIELCSARPWQAKSRPRQLAETQFAIDRDNAHFAKESWKTLQQLMYNDLRNAMDSHDMVSKHGPANWGPELMSLGALNNGIAALSTIPPYVAQNPTFPMPMVNQMAGLPAAPLPVMPPVAAIPRMMPAPIPAIAPRMAPLAPAPIMPPALPMAPLLAPAAPPIAAPSFVNNIPVSVGPTIMGFAIVAMLGPMEAIAPSAVHFDIAVQRLTAVEGVAEKAAMMGGDGVINLRLVTMPTGDVVAGGDVVKLLPLM